MQTNTQVFHRKAGQGKGEEYLLITHSFPHSSQLFPQGLSTSGKFCGRGKKVHIKRNDALREFSHFFEAVDFTM